MAQMDHFKTQARIPLPGSEKAGVANLPVPIVARAIAPEPEDGNVTVTVVLRRRREIDPSMLTDRRARLTRDQFSSEYGPDPASLTLIEAFAQEYGLKAVPHESAGRRSVSLTGSESAMQQAFGVTLAHQNIGGHTFRVREGAIMIPQELAGHVVAVLGLDNRPQAKPHSLAAVPHASNLSYTPVQVAELYRYPAGVSAAGQTIGIIELGGGYRETDISAYFQSLGIPAPTITAVSVDRGKNTPGKATGADGEVMLDIEVCASVAPRARIVVYFAPNTDQGFIDAIATAVHDTTNKPSVISISWGGPESTWTKQAANALDAACQTAAVLGVTITVAAGDSGATDGLPSGKHVDFPASSPHVLACGGTKLVAANATIKSEVVWNELANDEGATGGGVSAIFPIPAWQTNEKVPASMRGVPDVAGDADPTTGYTIRVDGETMVIGGTSAVAPLWAGLIALANARNGTDAGFINPTLYKARDAFRDITVGNNGGFSAGPGWDACTGLGTPIGTAVIAALHPARIN
jgi:kumamolisin